MNTDRSARQHMSAWLVGVVCASAVLFVLNFGAAAAHASTIDLISGQLIYAAAPGETNAMVVSQSGGSVIFTESGAAVTITAVGGSGCTLDISSTVATCSVAGVSGVTVAGDDGDDSLAAAASLGLFVTLSGGDGADVLVGGPGNDSLIGGVGNDTLDGGAGADVLYGGDGRDEVTYASRTAPITADLAGAGAGDGQAGENDSIQADVEDLVGGSAADNLSGGAGDNELTGGAGNDQLDGGDGSDDLIGDAGDDTLNGEAGRDSLFGLAGDDKIDGGTETDLLVGGLGSDVLRGGSGPDRLEGEEGSDDLAGESDSDWLYGGPDDDKVDGGDDPDNVSGGGGNDIVFGGSGNDIVADDGGGDDTLDGGPGDDRLESGAGADRLIGGSGRDRVDYSVRTDPVLVTLDDVADDGVSGEYDLVNVDIEDVTTGFADDVIVGSSAENALDGGSGSDQLSGGAGDDELSPGTGPQDGVADADVIVGNDGADTVSYSRRRDPVAVSLDGSANDGSAGEGDNVAQDIEILVGGQGGDTLTGNRFGNEISGEAGDDRLSGGAGVDTLDGGQGADQLFGGPSSDTVDYSASTSAVKVDLDGAAGDDGAAGEGDTVGADVENIEGTSRADLLIGNDRPNVIIAGRGADIVSGLEGNDRVFVRDVYRDGVDCGGGSDIVLTDSLDEIASNCEHVERGELLTMILSGAKLQRPLKTKMVWVFAVCDSDCKVTATATLRGVRGHIKQRKLTLKSDVRRKVKFVLSKRQLRSIGRALRKQAARQKRSKRGAKKAATKTARQKAKRRIPVSIDLRVRAVDESGNESVGTRRITLHI